ncbi:MAG: twin-arginine translocase subunit TatC [Planctomycetota bacterium]
MNRKAEKAKIPDTIMTLGEHLEELRTRLILALAGVVISAIGCMLFGGKIVAFLEAPYLRIMPDAKLQVLAPAAGFIAYMKIAMISGLIISSPWVFYHIWMFVAAGLYPPRKKIRIYSDSVLCGIVYTRGIVLRFPDITGDAEFSYNVQH